MFDDIEKELLRQCEDCKCKLDCKKDICVVYRILHIMTASDIAVSKINIDDFFETGNKDQITIFEYLENNTK